MSASAAFATVRASSTAPSNPRAPANSNGRPRLVHGLRDRALGFADRDLKTDAGAWLTYEQAQKFSDSYVKEVEALRASGKRIKPAKPLRAGNVEDLLDDWFNSDEVQSLAPSSISSYQKAKRAVVFRPESRQEAKERRQRERAAKVLGITIPEREREPIAAEPPAAIGAPELRDFFNYLKGARGHHIALAAIAALSAAFTWGRESTKWRLARNPRLEMEFDRPEGRVVLISFEDFFALVAAADSPIIGRPSICDAIYLGLFTGQRQTDRLALKDEGLVNGRRHFRQSKTKALCGIKETPQLAARMAQARIRVAELKLKLKLREMPETIVVDETTGRPYNEHTYRHLFAEIRDLAIKGHGDVAPCPSLAFINERTGAPDFKHDQDLRDTCVILLDRAGNDLLSICDVTGHSYQSAQTIMKHYRSQRRARRCRDRPVGGLHQQGRDGRTSHVTLRRTVFKNDLSQSRAALKIDQACLAERIIRVRPPKFDHFKISAGALTCVLAQIEHIGVV